MIDLDTTKLEWQLTRMLQACDTLAQDAQTITPEVIGHMQIAAQVNIYLTAPGAYQRTGDLLRGLNARATATRNTATITVLNDATDEDGRYYAGYVERGRNGPGDAALQQLAAQRPDPSQPLTLGRSGVDWTVPAPILIGAQVYALTRLQQLFAQKIARALR
jgi:hypothetical protein